MHQLFIYSISNPLIASFKFTKPAKCWPSITFTMEPRRGGVRHGPHASRPNQRRGACPSPPDQLSYNWTRNSSLWIQTRNRYDPLWFIWILGIHVFSCHPVALWTCPVAPWFRTLRCISVTALVASSGELKQTKPKPWHPCPRPGQMWCAEIHGKAWKRHPKIIQIDNTIIYDCIIDHWWKISHVISHDIPWKYWFNNPM